MFYSAFIFLNAITVMNHEYSELHLGIVCVAQPEYWKRLYGAIIMGVSSKSAILFKGLIRISCTVPLYNIIRGTHKYNPLSKVFLFEFEFLLPP